MAGRDPDPPDAGALFRAHAPSVARWAQRLGGPELTADIEDIVQEVFITVDRLLPGFRGDAAVTTWIFEITSNIVRRHRRRLKLRRWLTALRGADVAPAPEPPATPADALERRQAVARAYAILDGLAEKYRRVFILYELEGLSGQEIAELTGEKLKTVWVHLHRARRLFDERVARETRIEASRAERGVAGKRLPRGTP
jgi:RNA polymerase sigma-70 factor (ECF subfamily)